MAGCPYEHLQRIRKDVLCIRLVQSENWSVSKQYRLDAAYGVDRDVEKDDGGFILVVEKVCDLCQVEQMGLKLDGIGHEALDVIQSESGLYLNALFLCHNEFGINVILPMRMAPQGLVRQFEKKRLTTDVTGDDVHMEYFLIGFTGTMIILVALEHEGPVRRSR